MFSWAKVLLNILVSALKRERPLMTSDFRVGRGVQNDPKIGRFRVERGR